MKKLLIVLFLGISMMLLAVAFAAVSVIQADVVGGADFPAFVFYFEQFAWMAWIGALFAAASIVLMITKKK